MLIIIYFFRKKWDSKELSPPKYIKREENTNKEGNLAKTSYKKR